MSSVSLINGHIDDDMPRMTPQEAIDFIKNKVEIDVRFCGKEDLTKTEEAFELAIFALEKLADLVEVVRCKDCGHYNGDVCATLPCNPIVSRKPDDYCGYGRRRNVK